MHVFEILKHVSITVSLSYFSVCFYAAKLISIKYIVTLFNWMDNVFVSKVASIKTIMIKTDWLSKKKY